MAVITPKKHRVALQTLTWKEASPEVHRVNSALAGIVDELSPNDAFKLYRARYSYGSQILENGRFFLPTHGGQLIPLEHEDVGSELQTSLNYNMGTNPVTLVLSKSLELFIPVKNRIATYSLIPEGTLFGVWYVLNHPLKNNFFFTPIPIWDLTAGARSLFMLPKITESTQFHHLQKQFNIKCDLPHDLSDHWQVFREIASHESINSQWETEVLYFSKEWFEHLNDRKWSDFKTYIMDSAWRGSEFWRNQFIWDLTFSRIQNKRGIKPCPYITNVVRHIYGITVGGVPGFRPATDESYAPIKAIQNAFTDVYHIRYAPVIIGPHNFSVFENNDPVYYSFHYQTALELPQKSRKRSSLITDLYHMHSLSTKYLEEIISDEFRIRGTTLYEMATVAKYDYCHHNVTGYPNMTSSQEILKLDPRFKESVAHLKNKSMPKNPPFLNGCIKISRKRT